MAGGVVLGIRLRFHDHAPEQAAVVLAFHQPATHQVRSHHFCWAAEEGLAKGWEILGDGLGGYVSGWGDNLLQPSLTTPLAEATIE